MNSRRIWERNEIPTRRVEDRTFLSFLCATLRYETREEFAANFSRARHRDTRPAIRSGKCNSIADSAGHDAGDRLRRGRHGLVGGVEARRPHDNPPVGSFGSGFPCERGWEPSVEVEAL